jgi:F-type H+-transporting ATPase subunit epsilon
MATFAFELVSPEKLLFSGEVDAVVAPGIEGEFTVLKDHAPFMTTLKPGVIEIDVGSKKEKLFVRGGFADVASSGFTVLADYAIPLGDLGASAIDADIEAAEAALKGAEGNETHRLAQEKRDQLRELKAALKL